MAILVADTTSLFVVATVASNSSQRVRKRVVYLFGVLVMLVGVLLRTSWHTYVYPVSIPREHMLKQDLKTMRQAIANYTVDKKGPPQTLQDLVDNRYLRQVPVDPVTYTEHWQLHFANVQVSPTSAFHGLDNVYSSSTKISSEGTPYNTW